MQRCMDLARRVYSRDLKIAAMREIDGGRPISEVARHLELSPHRLEQWRRGKRVTLGDGSQPAASGSVV